MDDGNAPERILTGQWGCPAQAGVIFPTKNQLSVDPGPFKQGTGSNDPNGVNGHWGHGCSIPVFVDIDPNFTFGAADDGDLATVTIDNLVWTNSLALPVATAGVFLVDADPNLFCAPGFGTAGDYDYEIHQDGSVDAYYPARLTLFFCAFPPLPLVFGQQSSTRRGPLGYFFRAGDPNEFAGPSPIIPRGNANQICNPAGSGPSGDWDTAAPVPGLTPIPRKTTSP